MKKIFTLSTLLFALYANAQVGFGTPTPNASAQVDISASDKGLLIPRISLTSTTQQLSTANANAHSLLIYNNGTILPEGFYYWKSNIENNVDNGSWIAVGSESSVLPKFFYMPSVILPTTLAQSQLPNPNYGGVGDTTNPPFVNKPGMSYDESSKVFTINLYEIFSNQFTSPLVNTGAQNGLADFVLAANHYDYFITKADESVFTDVTLSELGVLTYKVKENAVARDGSYMNIVLKAK